MQTITTLLAYSLPLVQFFFAAIPEKATTAFIFRENFLIVSIFTAMTAYIMILAVKANPYYSWSPFQSGRVQKNAAWNTYTNPARFTAEEIATFQKKNKPPKPIYQIDSSNIVPKVLVPVITISFIIFFMIALIYQINVIDKKDLALLAVANILQMLAYVVFVVGAVLALASQFLSESGLKNYKKENGQKFDKAIDLVRQRNGFGEYKTISLITQTVKRDPTGTAYNVFYVKVNAMYFIFITDIDVDMVYNVQSFETKELADRFYYSDEENSSE